MNKVIIVEDDRIIRRSLSIELHGKNMVLYWQGKQQMAKVHLNIIEKEQPQVVISDISMPFMNGLEMARSIKDTSPYTKVIF